MKNRIISNYTITNDNQIPLSKITERPVVVKEASINTEDFRIDSSLREDTKKKEPVVQVNKNAEGIITTLDIICACGEKITIKLEY